MENVNHESRYHDLFYNKFVGHYKGLVSNGSPMAHQRSLMEMEGFEVFYCFEPRLDTPTSRDFERDRWNLKRELVIGSYIGSRLYVLTSYNRQTNTLKLYQKSFAKLKEPAIALSEAVELFEKFFTLEMVDKYYDNRYVDVSSNRSADYREVVQ